MAVLGLLAVFGYVARVEAAYGWSDLPHFALPESLGLFLLALAVWRQLWTAQPVVRDIFWRRRSRDACQRWPVLRSNCKNSCRHRRATSDKSGRKVVKTIEEFWFTIVKLPPI